MAQSTNRLFLLLALSGCKFLCGPLGRNLECIPSSI
jgi:hypothetical protein